MASFLYDFIDHWIIDDFDIQNIRDILLEFLAVIAFVFLLVVIIIAMIKAPMLIGHGSIEMSIFVVFGLIHAVMNILDEFIWFTEQFYPIWKTIKDLFLLIGAIVLMVGFYRFFIFSARLFGTDSKKEKEDIKEEKIEEMEEAIEEVAEEIEETEEDLTEDEIVDDVIEEVVEETLEDTLEEAVDEDVYDNVIEDIVEEATEETTEEEPVVEVTEEEESEAIEMKEENIEEEKSTFDAEFP